jgi:hypothetical protein
MYPLFFRLFRCVQTPAPPPVFCMLLVLLGELHALLQPAQVLGCDPGLQSPLHDPAYDRYQWIPEETPAGPGVRLWAQHKYSEDAML